MSLPKAKDRLVALPCPSERRMCKFEQGVVQVNKIHRELAVVLDAEQSRNADGLRIISTDNR